MTKHTITLDGDFAIGKGPRDKSWHAQVTADLAALPEGIITDLIMHGLKQKVADAASGAKDETEALPAMQKALDAIMKGEWSSRGEASGVSEETRVQRQVTRELFKAKVGGKSPEWATFTGLSDGDQAAKLDAMFAKNEAALAPAVEEKLAALKAERARKASLTAEFNI